MASGKVFTQQEFGDALDNLTGAVRLGKAYVQLSRTLTPDLSANLAIANIAPVFWLMSAQAIAYFPQMAAFKLFDTNPGALTMRVLLGQATKLKRCFPHRSPDQIQAIVDIANQQIANTVGKRWAQLDKKRNSLLAHMDMRHITNPSALTGRLDVKWSDLNVIFGHAESMLGDLSLALRNSRPDFTLPGVDDYRHLLEAVNYWLNDTQSQES